MVANAMYYDDENESNGDDEEGDILGDDRPPAEIKVHLGRNLFAVAKKSHSTVDIRHHFFTNENPNSLHPTRRGLSLSGSEFRKLQDILPRIERCWGGLAETLPCYSLHNSSQEIVDCDHCTPKPSPKHPARQRGGRSRFVNNVSHAQGGSGYQYPSLASGPPKRKSLLLKADAMTTQNIVDLTCTKRKKQEGKGKQTNGLPLKKRKPLSPTPSSSDDDEDDAVIEIQESKSIPDLIDTVTDDEKEGAVHVAPKN